MRTGSGFAHIYLFFAGEFLNIPESTFLKDLQENVFFEENCRRIFSK